MAFSKADYAKAEDAVSTLWTQAQHETFHHHRFLPEHFGSDYKDAIVQHVAKVDKLADKFRPEIFRAASRISAISGPEWEKTPEILSLWHRVALAVVTFSQHPSKKVATLIISENGELQAFGANRVPEGVPTRGEHYVQGERKDYIVCSERIAIAQFLGLKVDAEKLSSSESDGGQNTRSAIRKLTEDIVELGKSSALLKDSFLLSTTALCELCAHAVAPLAPRAVITSSEGGDNFTRAGSIVRATEFLAAQKIPVIHLSPAFV